MSTIEPKLDDIRRLAREAGSLALGYFRKAEYERKGDRSMITKADVEASRLIVDDLRQRYPDHAILSEEEKARDLREEEYVWAVDPIDGTVAFVSGLPVWGISIGLLRKGEPILGVFYMPVMDEIYSADDHEGALMGDQPLQVDHHGAKGRDSWVGVPSMSHRRFQISFRGKVRSLGSTAAHFVYAARGSALAAVARAHLWDLAGALAVLTRAGGVYSYLSGEPADLTSLCDGSVAPEPLVGCAPEHMGEIRRTFTYVPPGRR